MKIKLSSGFLQKMVIFGVLLLIIITFKKELLLIIHQRKIGLRRETFPFLKYQILLISP
jgi:hypothetical protein